MLVGWRQIRLFFRSFVLYISAVILIYSCGYLSNNKSCTMVVTRQNTYEDAVINFNRWRIKFKVTDLNNTCVDKLEDLLPECGGKPIRTLIVATWRFGSSFLGDVYRATGDMLRVIPESYYHYEPLRYYGSLQRITKQKDEAIQMLKDIFKCNFRSEKMEDFLRYIQNFILPTKIKLHPNVTTNGEFVSNFCKLFPFHTMKLVRLRLRDAEDLIADEGLNLRTVLLIRDPRAAMYSRIQLRFCRNSTDCNDPRTLCDGMVSDHGAARNIMRKYPGKLMVLRFEDLVNKLHATKSQLLKFLRLPPHSAIDRFLSSHTRKNIGGPFSVFRNSTSVLNKWTKFLKFEYVDDLQRICKKAMELWGYNLANNATHMEEKNFYTLKPYFIL